MNNKLNAYVRFDGTGKIVPSSVILQRTKPKVGNWKQIDSSECCNYTTTTTSTTMEPTTTSTTTEIPVYAYGGYFSYTNNDNACFEPDFSLGVVSLSSVLEIGVQLFLDGSFEIPAYEGWFAVDGEYVYHIGVDGFIDQIGTPCSEIIINVTDRFVNCTAGCNDACAEPWDYFNVYMTYGCYLSFPTVGCAIWEDESATRPFPDGIYNNGNGNCIIITDGVITNIV